MVMKLKRLGLILFTCLYLFSLLFIVFLIPYAEAGWGNEFNDSFEDGDFSANPEWSEGTASFDVVNPTNHGLPGRDGTYVLRNNVTVSAVIYANLSGALSVDTHLSFSTYFNDSTVRKLQIALAPSSACSNDNYSGMTFQALGKVQYLLSGSWNDTGCTYSSDTWEY